MGKRGFLPTCLEQPEQYVTAPLRFSLDLPTDPTSIPRARQALAPVETTVDQVTWLNLKLLVSELVTNAIRHVPSDHATGLQVVVTRTERLVRVEVVDHGVGFVPRPPPEAEDRASGWGLNILAKLASRWGVENDDGARVWFEIDAPLPARGASGAAVA